MTDPSAEASRVSAQPRRTLMGLEAGRGLASLFVVVAHASIIVAEPRFYGSVLWGGRLEKFGAGVDFFFVLSGFIIAWAHWGDIGRPDRLANYATRRFRRIYPPYWLVLLPLSLAYALFPAAGQPEQHDPWNVLFSFLLLPYPAHPVLGVAWTLVYEVIFYVVFGLSIRAGRAALWLLPVWGGAILAANVLHVPLPFPLTILLDSINLEFLFGVSVAWYLRGRRVPFPTIVAIAGFAAFLFLILLPAPVLANPLLYRIGYGLSVATGMLGLVEYERTRGLRVPAALRYLGAGSYAVYLVHGIALSIGVQILSRATGRGLPLAVAIAVLVAGAVVAGLLFHRFAERPLGRWLAHRARRRQVRRHPE